MAPAKKAKPLGWTKLNDALRNASETEAKALMAKEIAAEGRYDFIRRCYTRYAKMRRVREMDEVSRSAKNVEV
jgi:hypothetical protein